MTSRLSRWVPNASPAMVPGAYTNMLREDISKGVVPYGHQGQVYRLSGNSNPRHQLLAALELSGGYGGIDDFVRTVAILLVDSHRVWIEVFAQDGPKGDVPFGVAPVSNVRLGPGRRILQQLPPKEALPEWVTPDDQWGSAIELDRDRVVRVELPNKYSSKDLNTVERDLAAVPLMTTPGWSMEQVSGQNSGGPVFDFKEAARTDRLAALQAALPIGWPAREVLMSSDRNINEYYRYLRGLRFLHFLASLRVEAEAALRDVLMIARDLCDISAEVTSYDLCTPADISEYIRQFEAGELSFSKVRDIVFQRPGFAKDAQRRIV